MDNESLAILSAAIATPIITPVVIRIWFNGWIKEIKCLRKRQNELREKTLPHDYTSKDICKILCEGTNKTLTETNKKLDAIEEAIRNAGM